jgi:hypothetical protein
VIGVLMRRILEKYRDRVTEMKKWSSKLKMVIKEEGGGGGKGRGGRRRSINLAIVSANNHYAGFGPLTIPFSILNS